MGLGKVWPDLEISEAFLMGLEISFSGDFCISESEISFADGSIWSSGVEFFRVHGYKQVN